MQKYQFEYFLLWVFIASSILLRMLIHYGNNLLSLSMSFPDCERLDARLVFSLSFCSQIIISAQITLISRHSRSGLSKSPSTQPPKHEIQKSYKSTPLSYSFTCFRFYFLNISRILPLLIIFLRLSLSLSPELL